MKTIIDQKRYDTDTSERVGKWSNYCSYSDFNHCEETLYRTKAGAFFLHGKGGALSPYASIYGRSFYEGERMVPISIEAARDWCEKREQTDVLELLFGDTITDA